MKKSTVDSVEMPAKISIRLAVARDLCSCTNCKWHCAISKWCMRNLQIPDLNPVADFVGWAGASCPALLASQGGAPKLIGNRK